ncbi:MAG: GNAT family N-acetyltransferase [Mangrovibacterium sp.]
MEKGQIMDNALQQALTMFIAYHNFIAHFSSETWGSSILIMEKSGNAFARVYWYYDDTDTIYLDMLSVSEKCRKQGVGTKLQEVREKIGVDLGAKTACLLVKKLSWMYYWYQRRGYFDFKDHEDKEWIWMKKPLFSKR